MITLTNGVQIPENAVQLQTAAAIDGYYVTQPLRLVQYDETLPVAAVQLTYQNQPYTPPTGAELNVRMNKPDGKGVYNPCLGVDSSGIVYFVFTQQMTIVAGDGKLTIEVTDSGVKSSASITVNVAENPVQEGQIESADEFLTLQEILAEAEKWGQIVQTNASNIQQVVDNLADIQNAAENAQAAAASAAAAQQAVQEALGFRTFFSAVRPDSNGNLDPSRPMTVGPASSVEIESAGDRIQSVTALGFTEQAGTGDPSPTNVRALTCGGLKLVEVAFTGSESWRLQSGAYLASGFTAGLANGVGYASPVKFQYGYGGQGIFVDGTGAACLGSGAVTALGYTDVSQWKADLQAAYNAGMPYKMWYQPADESKATGLYAPIILTSGEYRATCLPLTAPLCEGDSVVSWVKSGCDVELAFNGSEDEAWGTETLSGNVIRYWIKLDSNIAQADSSNGFALSNWLTLAILGGTGNALLKNVFTITGDQKLYVRTTNETLDEFKAKLKANPLFVCCRSTNYTEAADIPVSLETHVQWAANVFDVTRTWTYRDDIIPNLFTGIISPQPKTAVCVCDTYKGVATSWNLMQDNQIQLLSGGSYIGIRDSRYSTADELEQALQNTPVTIVYQLAAPITYAHEAVVLEAATGDQLTYTVTGQSGGTVSVALKPFQDGGHAATAGNARQLGGLTLLAIKESMTPVGYIFSWAPVDDGPDLSTPTKVADYFGFGTWAAYGTGQVLVGVDSGQTEFATVGKTGGEKTHTLTEQELPSVSPGVKYSNGKPIAFDSGDTDGYKLSFTSENVAPNNIVAPFGGGQAHNNLQPYITVYRWQRIA